MTHLTAGELRKLIEGKRDNYKVPIHIKYGPDIETDSIFVRLDNVHTGNDTGNDPGDRPGVVVTLSLVAGEH